MQINSNLNIGSIHSPNPRPPVARDFSQPADEIAFRGSESIEKALEEAPASRPEKVARARELIADGDYPPRETIRKIAFLLAGGMGADSQ